MSEQHWNLLLFDVDGVIIDPRAYRLGINKTLGALLETVGVADATPLLLDESDVAFMESLGIHDIWDITNISFAMFIVSVSRKLAEVVPDFRLADVPVIEQLRSFQCLENRTPFDLTEKPNYRAFATSVSTISDSTHPPDAALALLSREVEDRKIGDTAGWINLLRAFLAGTRTPYESYGTRVFQNILLGSEEFTSTYGLESEYEGKSFLNEKDRVLISPSTVARLKALSQQPLTRIGIYTARPSRPPNEYSDEKGYSPEAELALEMAGMSEFPLVAMGMMEWLAGTKNQRQEDLTKPNTTQAMAALMACIRGKSDGDVLQQAYAVDKLNMNPTTTALAPIAEGSSTVYVFEDTVSGIKPMLEIAKRLNAQGFAIDVVPLGIAGDSSKVEALRRYTDAVFPNVNAAVASQSFGQS